MKAIRFPLLIVICLGTLACGLYGPKNMFDLFFGSTTKPPIITNPVREDVRLAVLWAGRSTMLIQVKDKLILTDPFLSDFAGGMMRRIVSAGIDLKSLPRLDLVLLSHAHFDHLCYVGLRMIAERFPGSTLVFPQGVEPFLPDIPLNLLRLKTSYFREGFFGQKDGRRGGRDSGLRQALGGSLFYRLIYLGGQRSLRLHPGIRRTDRLLFRRHVV
jgi:hypothetical protein